MAPSEKYSSSEFSSFISIAFITFLVSLWTRLCGITNNLLGTENSYPISSLTIVLYPSGGGSWKTKLDEQENSSVNSWENFRQKVINFVDTIPNHIRIKLNTSFFEGPSPETEEIFKNNLAEFGNSINVHAADVSQILSEWEEIAENEDFTFRNLLVGTSQRMALENFIEDNLHPKFVYFSDYKKIIGNINLTEYLKQKEDAEHSVEYVEEFDKSETVDNLFFLADLAIHVLEKVKPSQS